MSRESSPRRGLGLALGALGIVYGDIGTSPLYALRECFHGDHALSPTRSTVLGVLSAVIWSLIVIVCLKYLIVVMRANNQGEGGIMALLALTLSRLPANGHRTPLLILGACGAALLLGEGMITPAITVLSAVEGLEAIAPAFHPYVVPITVFILVALFAIQRIGTGRVGAWFGPITLLWFFTLALLGVRGLLVEPSVLSAFNPMHGVNFLMHQGWGAFVVLGAVFLTLTGVEALYADMGHFGVGPIRLAWFAVVFPALVLNYLGQGAWLLKQPDAVRNPFYNLAPSWALIPLIILATLAAIIASQALISGAFSMVRQAMQLGFLPRMNVQHTSSTERGQIYVGAVNWILMIACIGLVLGFRTSNALAAAYGIGVSLTIMMTTLLLFFAAQHVWGWPRWRAGLLSGSFLTLEIAFFAANSLKFENGGWFPITMGALIYLCMATWFRGRRAVQKELLNGSLPLGMFLNEVERHPPARVAGTAVFLSSNPQGTPGALLHNLKHNKVLHERVVILRFAVAEAPYVEAADRVQIEGLSQGFFRVTGYFGFMESPDLDAVRDACGREGLELDVMKTTYFLGRETILPTSRPGMARWRKRLFGFMARNAQQATGFFKLPPNRVVELGMQVEI
ncbi:MAG: potassium transporter Kup [Verrucomicrobiales bacterium]|nr:potassium transporter Kup [Verrucomicrobiales bacterium]